MAEYEEELEGFREELDVLDVEEAEDFQYLVREAVDTVFPDRQSAAEYFSVTPPTVDRWIEGEVVPLGPIAALFEEYIEDLIAYRLDEIDEDGLPVEDVDRYLQP